ncbi:MAG: FtsQ-type POTRA domain-containing protein [Hyphomicrobiaceae bacterium]|nr:FtsQ-type POTRA domain-containing protein [Hyphomicrobiaceae bacterium]
MANERPPRHASSWPSDLLTGQSPAFDDRDPARGRPRLPRWFGLMRASALAALSAGALFLVLTDGGGRSRVVTPRLPEIDQLATLAGFGVEQVTVRGQRFTSDDEIFEALDLARALSFASLDSSGARARLEALPWVSRAVIRRIYPGELVVEVVERTPFAVWHAPDATHLIDRTGRVLSRIMPAAADPRLPVIAGLGAAQEAEALFNLVARCQPLAGRLAVAHYVSGRRWSLALTGGVRIELPSEGAAAALSQLETWGGLEAALDGPGTVIDLRSAAAIVVRHEDGAAGGAAERPADVIGDLLRQPG